MNAKTESFKRHERDEHNRLLIDVSCDSVEDLFSHWDRNAPFIRRDLDSELADYLIESADELEREPFAIQFSFKHAVDEGSLIRVTKSINVYFHYLADSERRQIARMLRKSLLLLLLGLIVLFVAIWVGEWMGPNRSVLENVFAEGLTIAAWVSLWESLATFLIEWFPARKRVQLYLRLADSPLSFRSQPLPPGTAIPA